MKFVDDDDDERHSLHLTLMSENKAFCLNYGIALYAVFTVVVLNCTKVS